MRIEFHYFGGALILEEVAAYLVLVLLLASMTVWAVHLRPLLRRLGGKPTSWVFNWAMLADYARLKRLLRQKGMKDRLVRIFEVLYGGAAIVVFLMVIKAVWGALVSPSGGVKL